MLPSQPREELRRHSYVVPPAAGAVVAGLGTGGYRAVLRWLAARVRPAALPARAAEGRAGVR